MGRRRTNWSLPGYQKELEELNKTKLETTKVTTDSVDSTRRMLRLIDECQDAGINTLRMLHHQGETLDRTEGGLDEVHDYLDQGDKTLKKMERLKKIPCIFLPCYLCCCNPKPNPIKSKSKNQVKDDENWARSCEIGRKGSYRTQQKPTSFNVSAPQDSRSSTDSTKVSKFNRPSLAEPHRNGNRYFVPITGEKEEDEMEDNLGQISTYLGSVKSQAQEMGSTVSRQNNQLDRMNTKTQVNHSKVKDLTERSVRLINSDSSNSGFWSFCPCDFC